jgi:hypothetical protein
MCVVAAIDAFNRGQNGADNRWTAVEMKLQHILSGDSLWAWKE